jgi:hypothetical protein
LCSARCAETIAEPFDAPDRVLLFSGVELARSSGLLYGGFVWSPEGLDAEGLAIKVLTAAGTYRYRSGEATIYGGHTLVSALPGWRLKRQHFEATIYGGLDLQSHVFLPDDPNNPMRGHRAGLRLAVDFWCEPTADTMAQAWATWSSADKSYVVRGALGWRPFDWFYIGPETQVLGDGEYRQFRFGIHVTAWRSGRFEWSAGTGFAREQDHDAGVYVRLGMLARR